MTTAASALLILACLWPGAATPASAGEVKLFNAVGRPVLLYDQRLLYDVHPGDVVNLGFGRRFTVLGQLARTPNTVLFDIGNGLALRLPATRGTETFGVWGLGRTRHDPKRLIESTIDGYADLARWGLPVVKIYPELSRGRAYAVVEKIEVRFLLSKYLEGKVDGLSDEQRRVLDDELVDFAASFWPFRSIGDARPEQVAYTSRGWILLDWTHQHKPLFRNSPDDDNFVLRGEGRRANTEYFGMSAPIYERLGRRISQRVLELRQQHRAELGYSCATFLLNPLLELVQ